MNEFMDVGMLTTFGGLALAVGVIVQFTKSIIKRNFGVEYIRLYAFIIALILSFVFVNESFEIQSILITVLNAVLITISTTGGYEIITDPLAEKTKDY